MNNPKENDGLNTTEYKIQTFPSGSLIQPNTLRAYKDFNKFLRNNYESPNRRLEWEKHFDNSKRTILHSSTGLKGDALILGMGNAMDIPLEELASQFDEITVVEIDQEAGEFALRRLPTVYQKKFNLIVDDLSGATGQAYDVISEQFNRDNSPNEVLRNISSQLKGVFSRPLDLEKDYSFACSSLILSQLVSQVHEYAAHLWLNRFKTRLFLNQRTIGYFQSLTLLSERLQREHIGLIYSSLNPSGKAYVSDTIYQTELAKDARGNIVVIGQSEVMISPETAREIDSRFDVVAEHVWEWRRNPPPNMLTPGDGFKILALDLKKK